MDKLQALLENWEERTNELKQTLLELKIDSEEEKVLNLFNHYATLKEHIDRNDNIKVAYGENNEHDKYIFNKDLTGKYGLINGYKELWLMLFLSVDGNKIYIDVLKDRIIKDQQILNAMNHFKHDRLTIKRDDFDNLFISLAKKFGFFYISFG